MVTEGEVGSCCHGGGSPWGSSEGTACLPAQPASRPSSLRRATRSASPRAKNCCCRGNAALTPLARHVAARPRGTRSCSAAPAAGPDFEGSLCCVQASSPSPQRCCPRSPCAGHSLRCASGLRRVPARPSPAPVRAEGKLIGPSEEGGSGHRSLQ